MSSEVFGRLVWRGLVDGAGLENIVREARTSGGRVEDLLIERGVPRYEVLLCLSHHYGLPFVEYDEDILVSSAVMRRIDPERLKSALWFPISVFHDKAEVIVCNPREPAVVEDIKETLGVHAVEFTVALPGDLVRIIENNQDLNPVFPPTAGRTPLALVRTYLADRRTSFARQRTALAKGRTGLAFLRTGIAFITISIVLYRLFGASYISLLGLPLLAGGVAAVFDGFKWYFSARNIAVQNLDYVQTGPTDGFTVLEVSNPGHSPDFARSRVVDGAEELRKGWANLSPVERRRFLANDRTDMAEERTALAALRTRMAKARTGLAFTRTGIAFAGLGIGLLRHFPSGPWTFFDAALIAAGAVIALESFQWYLPARSAANQGLRAVRNAQARESIWDFSFPRFYRSREAYAGLSSLKACKSPSIWGTSGLALERTVLAERRNLMARLRTVMARSRTAMAFIRTGLSMSAVGMGLLIFFGVGSIPWTVFDAVLTMTGLILVVDGLLWYFPAEKVKGQFPYCFGDMEITIPDYGTSPQCWGKVVFSHDDI